MYLAKRLFLVSILMLTTKVLAQESESYSHYDDIVAELKASAEDPVPPAANRLEWDDVAMHGGIGLASSYTHLIFPMAGGVMETSGLLMGFELHGGMNLFSRVARLEVAFRNFPQKQITPEVAVKAKDYEGRLLFVPQIFTRTSLRMGTGLSLHEVNVSSLDGTYSERPWRYSVLLGLERKVAESVSLGPDFSYRAPLASATFEKSSWDASFRLNATF